MYTYMHMYIHIWGRTPSALHAAGGWVRASVRHSLGGGRSWRALLRVQLRGRVWSRGRRSQTVGADCLTVCYPRDQSRAPAGGWVRASVRHSLGGGRSCRAQARLCWHEREGGCGGGVPLSRTRTHKHSFSFSHSLSRCLALLLSLFLSLSCSLSLARSRSLSLALSLFLSLSISALGNSTDIAPLWRKGLYLLIVDVTV